MVYRPKWWSLCRTPAVFFSVGNSWQFDTLRYWLAKTERRFWCCTKYWLNVAQLRRFMKYCLLNEREEIGAEIIVIYIRTTWFSCWDILFWLWPKSPEVDYATILRYGQHATRFSLALFHTCTPAAVVTAQFSRSIAWFRCAGRNADDRRWRWRCFHYSTTIACRHVKSNPAPSLSLRSMPHWSAHARPSTSLVTIFPSSSWL